jgi:hypothetical protein
MNNFEFCSFIDRFSALAFDAKRDVVFHLNTRRNLDSPIRLQYNGSIESIRDSTFDPRKPIRIIIHGFRQGDGNDLNLETSRSLLQHYDFNVIFVDWSAGSKTINYWAARARIRDVARVVSFFISKFFYSVNEWLKLKY